MPREILGIVYDLNRWTWNMDDRRWSVLVRELCKMEREKGARMKQVNDRKCGPEVYREE